MYRIPVIAALAFASAPAGATTLTFDDVTTTIYTTSYSESGYTLTASSDSPDTHIGDPFNLTAGTFGWHPGELNADPLAWTLTKDDASIFGLLSFDFEAYDISLIEVSAPGETTLLLASGTHTPGWTVESVTFSFSGFNEGWIDNVVLDDTPGVIPLPGSMPLAAAGIALLGLIRLRRGTP